MAPSLSPICIPPLSEPPFQCRGQGLLYNNESRTPLDHLQSWLFPKRKNTRPLNRSKAWWQAQLVLYGLGVPKKSETIATLRGRLEAALQSGKCDELPVDLKEKEDRLNKQFLEANVAERSRRYLQAGGRDEAKAAKDPDLFLREKFLSGDRNKDVCVLKLDGSDRSGVHEAAQILGLFTVSTDAPDGGRWIVAGNDRSLVWSEMRRISAETAEAQAAEKAAKRRKVEQLHAQFLASAASTGSSDGGATDITGQWHIHCEYIDEQWPKGGPLSLSIFRKSGKLRANFDFRIIQGVMKFKEQVNKKLQFRWRGSESGTGEILFMDDLQKGYIILESEGKLSGRIKSSGEPANCVFTGLKVSNKPIETDADWGDYDSCAHELARKGRW